jgi:hypothetical protein
MRKSYEPYDPRERGRLSPADQGWISVVVRAPARAFTVVGFKVVPAFDALTVTSPVTLNM